MKTKNWKYNIIYSVILLFFVVVIGGLFLRCTTPSLSEQLSADTVAFADGWCLADSTESVNLEKLHHLEEAVPGEEFCITKTLPTDLAEGQSLYFRSKNIFYSVWIDGEKVYEPEVSESVFYTNSFGTRWNCIALSQAYAGKQVELHVTTVYADARASVDNIYLGNSAGLVLSTIWERITAFITCVLLLFVGLLMMFADIPINTQKQKNHELLYLGMFAISISIWCLAETNLLQFYFDDSRTMQVVSCFSLMLIPIPLILYLDAAFGFRRKWFVPAICSLSVANIVICWGLHFLGIRDIHETLLLTHIMLAISATTLFFSIVRDAVLSRKKRTKKIYFALRTIGLSCLSVATIIDIIRFYQGTGSDTAMFVRIGLLIFIICYGCSSLENTINAVKLGIQTDFVRKLAYHDGLTGIGNRTAFQERLADMEVKKESLSQVGIVMFDVNDLKYVNDNMGHHYGDSMLTKSAQIIVDAFAPLEGECFRIGGDEFAVLLSGTHVAERYQEGAEQFRKGMAAHNEKPDKEFRISIAHGFSLYDKQTTARQKLMDVYQIADHRMYENKKRIKAACSPQSLTPQSKH